ncbi:dihydropterin-6-yl-methyl-4-(beta-D-ribofuranosyl)aminobenzene 5'-phosphate synthase 7-8 [Sporomusaceae bacterium BoRhaA]|uniref:MBL fold metallo-hydrolase n=1 Tax=Pelorhabdus rhamnosifermentans TaxID=2772457 RepID=UPI001C062C4E|nr:MBL fold metallo-hydrolase [Pelorhabdus rhamnosifermentans]MBU2703075.1 dihydropterin-6-yl-methyl-4-(beta-D-ribofuranosyl)aminobenzene 5'-phosphate synthase 7-8 [Pelorhabdus rhamnosifermentans]
MKLTVLVDNHTLIDRYFQGEPGVSYFIECDDRKYLFDTGYSGIFLRNAIKMGIDLLTLDGVVISHGHNDHTWGLNELVKLYSEAIAEGHRCKKPTVIAHPDAFLDKNVDGLDVGSMFSSNQLKKSFSLELGKQSLWLTDRLLFLGEIERTNAFEARTPIGKTLRDGIWEDDFVLDDSALVYRSNQGLIIITGCSHAGICNMIEYAKKICHEERVYDVIGGFHLLNPSQDKLSNTVEYLAKCQPHAIYACHCTDLYSKISLAQAMNVKEIGVGLVLEY